MGQALKYQKGIVFKQNNFVVGISLDGNENLNFHIKVKVDDRIFCLLGVEKIIELNWQGLNEFRGLLYHEFKGKYNCIFCSININISNPTLS